MQASRRPRSGHSRPAPPRHPPPPPPCWSACAAGCRCSTPGRWGCSACLGRGPWLMWCTPAETRPGAQALAQGKSCPWSSPAGGKGYLCKYALHALARCSWRRTGGRCQSTSQHGAQRSPIHVWDRAAQQQSALNATPAQDRIRQRIRARIFIPPHAHAPTGLWCHPSPWPRCA